MEVKKYRVICWQPQEARENDKVFVDIAPEDGVIHDMMFYSRLKLYRISNPNKMIKDVAKSVYLRVKADEKPEIEFSQRADLPHSVLKRAILQTYNEMRANQRESTLADIMSAYQTEAYKEEINGMSSEEQAFMRRQARKRQLLEEKMKEQTPQQKYEMQESDDFKKAIQRRKRAMSYRAQKDKEMDPIMRMRLRMQRFPGD